jgi:hypothetical protein
MAFIDAIDPVQPLRDNQSRRKPYARPTILIELDLETRAGTGPGGGPDLFCPGCPPLPGNPPGTFPKP